MLFLNRWVAGVNIHHYCPSEDGTIISFNTVTLAANSCLTPAAPGSRRARGDQR